MLFLTLALPAQAQDLGALVAEVDDDAIEEHIRGLSGADALALDGEELWLESRHVRHDDNELAVDWCLEQLGAIEGIEVWAEPFTWAGLDLHNVVAELPGAAPDRGMVIVSAHLDSTASLSAGWRERKDPAPGADDDASGMAAVLETARILAAVEPGFSRTVRFVLFNAEEVGLEGAQAHVDGLVDAGEEVHLVLQLDPVGYNPGGADFLWFSHDAVSLDHAAAVEALAIDLEDALPSTLRAEGVDEALIGGDDRSDHYPFWQQGIAALHFASYPQPDEYHTTEDQIDVVDPLFTASVSGLVLAYAAQEAELLAAEGDDGGAGGGGGDTGGCSVVPTRRTPPLTGLLAVLLGSLLLGRRRA